MRPHLLQIKQDEGQSDLVLESKFLKIYESNF